MSSKSATLRSTSAVRLDVRSESLQQMSSHFCSSSFDMCMCFFVAARVCGTFKDTARQAEVETNMCVIRDTQCCTQAKCLGVSHCSETSLHYTTSGMLLL